MNRAVIGRFLKVYLFPGIFGIILFQLWDAVQPYVLWPIKFLFNLGILGLSSVRDAAYADIGVGNSDRPGIFLLVTVAGCMLGLVMSAILRTRRNEQSSEAKSKRKILQASIALALTVFVNLVLLREVYVCIVIGNVENLQKIAAPYVTEQQRLEWKSKLGQVSTRDDFLLIVSTIRDAITRNGGKAPPLSFY